MIFAGCRSTLVFHSWPFTQISFGFITLCQSLSCDILCLNRPSLSSKWPWTKSNSLLPLRVRFDIHALSLIFKFRARAVIGYVWIYLVNFAIVMAASLNFPRELISHCLALKLLFQDILLWIFEILNKGHCLWIWPAFLDTIERGAKRRQIEISKKLNTSLRQEYLHLNFAFCRTCCRLS